MIVVAKAGIEIELSDQMFEWVEQRVGKDAFGDPGAYVRHLIEREQRRQVGVETLQTEISKGIESGIADPFDPEAFNSEMLARHQQ